MAKRFNEFASKIVATKTYRSLEVELSLTTQLRLIGAKSEIISGT